MTNAPGRGPERGDEGLRTEGPESSGGPPRIFTPEYYRRMDALEAHGWWNDGMRDVAGLLLDRVDLPRRGTLLDVGCGTGRTLAWFRARRPRWRAVGVDVAREGLALARRREGAGDARPELEEDPAGGLACADALELPLPDGLADLAISLDVLQHLPLGGGDARALGEMRRVLKPGGHLLVRTNAQAFPRREDDPEHDFHRYEPGGLRRRMEAAGFEVIRLSRINALLGLAEIPRELESVWREEETGYQGILAEADGAPSPLDGLKRAWLRLEGRMVASGARLPAGRSIVALARRRDDAQAGRPGGR